MSPTPRPPAAMLAAAAEKGFGRIEHHSEHRRDLHAVLPPCQPIPNGKAERPQWVEDATVVIIGRRRLQWKFGIELARRLVRMPTIANGLRFDARSRA